MSAIVEISGLTKTYDGGFTALEPLDVEIEEGEILALLGPNGAGKTTLISMLCGLVSPTGGHARIAGHDVVSEFRAARHLIGLVPQEIHLEPFQKVWDSLRFTRGLFGLPRDDAALEEILRRLSLWDKRGEQINALSGGMKRRVLIAKALSHEPKVLFLDEPTAGVDVELRRDMWQIVADLKAAGVTIILTTHYIEEAEAIADRVGVINKGRLLLIEDKNALMKRMGRKELRISLREATNAVPEVLADYDLSLDDAGNTLIYSYDTSADSTGITRLLQRVSEAGLALADIETRQSSLEQIFVDLVRDQDSIGERA